MAAEIPDGAVLIARAIFNSSLWTMRLEDRILAITMIGIANWRDKKWFDGEKEIVIKRGELVRSLEDLAEAANLSVKTVRTSLEHLEKTGFLARHQARRYTHVTLCKYDHYQNLTNYSDTTSGTARARLGQEAGTTPATDGHEAGNKQVLQEREEGKEREEGGRSSPMGMLLAKAQKQCIPGRPETNRGYFKAWIARTDYTRTEQIITDEWSKGKTVIEIQEHFFPIEKGSAKPALNEDEARRKYGIDNFIGGFKG